MDGSDFTFQVDLIHAVDQMDGYPTDSSAISPTAFLLNIIFDNLATVLLWKLCSMVIHNVD